MKRLLIECGAVLLLAVFIFFVMREKGTSGILPREAEEKLLAEGWLKPEEKAADLLLKRKLGLSAADYEDVVFYTGQGFMDVDEVLIVKTGDPALLDAVRSAVQTYLDRQKTTFEHYGTDQFGKLEGAQIWERDDYFVLVVRTDAADCLARIVREIER